MNSDPLIRPKGLSQLELVSLAIWFCTVGRWESAGLTSTEAQSFIMHFFECLTDNKKNALRANRLSLQNTFMAMRRGTFEIIQSEPPLRRIGKRNIEALLRAWLEGREQEFMKTWGEIFAPQREETVPAERPIAVRRIQAKGLTARLKFWPKTLKTRSTESTGIYITDTEKAGNVICRCQQFLTQTESDSTFYMFDSMMDRRRDSISYLTLRRG